MKEYLQESQEVLESLKSQENGLSSAEASARLEQYGKNKLKEEIFDKSVLQHSVDAFLGIADEIIVVGKYSVCGAKCVKAGSTRNK